MPRGRRIIITKKVDTDLVSRYKSIDLEAIKEKREKEESNLSKTVYMVYEEAKRLEKKRRSEEELMRKDLYSVQAAYDYLKRNGLDISFRAFGGRIERGSVPFVKIGGRRYIPKAALDDMLSLKNRFYTVREAYQLYKKYNPVINYRAFIGRIEKGSIPSVKLGTKRLIPKEAMDVLVRVSKDYYSVSQAISELRRAGIKLKRNAFERRLDRGRIPHIKLGGRRFIPKDVLQELIEKELSLRGAK